MMAWWLQPCSLWELSPAHSRVRVLKKKCTKWDLFLSNSSYKGALSEVPIILHVSYFFFFLLADHLGGSNADKADRLWELWLKKKIKIGSQYDPSQERPSNLPATVTVIPNPPRHLIEILILGFGLWLKIPEQRAPHHRDTPFSASHHRAHSVFLNIKLPQAFISISHKKRSSRKVLSERFQSVFYCLKQSSALTIS